MDSKRRVSVPAVVAVFAAALSFCAICSADPPFHKSKCDWTPRPNDIEVGDQVSCKLVVVSKGDPKHVIRWQSVDPTLNVKIEFLYANPPYSKINCDGTKRTCSSGPVDTTVAGDPQKIYLYKASLCSDASNCYEVEDPGIIIKP